MAQLNERESLTGVDFYRLRDQIVKTCNYTLFNTAYVFKTWNEEVVEIYGMSIYKPFHVLPIFKLLVMAGFF